MADRVVGVFVKAPMPGQVKTRLAAAIGSRRAAAVYGRMGRNTVLAVMRGSHTTVVWYTPRNRADIVRSWLEGSGVCRFEPQSSGDLGRRLAAAFACHFEETARQVVIVGSDCPQLGAPLIAAAFNALRNRDVVVGPTLDGGYYLIGLRHPRPALFRDVAWSSRHVLEQTLTHIRAQGLSHYLLPALRDVDTVADAQSHGLVEPVT